MTITLDDACWQHESVDLNRSMVRLVVNLIEHSYHAVVANATSAGTWCKTQVPAYFDLLEARLMSSQPRARAVEIRVTPCGEASATGEPPWLLNPTAASAIVGMQLKVFLENDDADWSFLKSIRPELGRPPLSAALEPTHGGGANLIQKIRKAGQDDVQRIRSFFLFDSDRLHPNEHTPTWEAPQGDGCQGKQFEECCRASTIPESRWYMLRRRAIENYLPHAALLSENRACTEVLFATHLSPIRPFYNMKRGLKGDGIWPASQNHSIRAARSMGVWAALPADQKDALSSGYGVKVASHFKTVSASHAWDHDVDAEADNILAALLNAI